MFAVLNLHCNEPNELRLFKFAMALRHASGENGFILVFTGLSLLFSKSLKISVDKKKHITWNDIR